MCGFLLGVGLWLRTLETQDFLEKGLENKDSEQSQRVGL